MAKAHDIFYAVLACAALIVLGMFIGWMQQAASTIPSPESIKKLRESCEKYGYTAPAVSSTHLPHQALGSNLLINKE